MCNAAIIVTPDGHVRGVHDWTEGFKPLKCPHKQHVSEDDVFAIALRFEKRGLFAEAEEVLDRYCLGYRRFLI